MEQTGQNKATDGTRTIREIALEIESEWKTPGFKATVYLKEMLRIDGPKRYKSNHYYSAVIASFLVHATHWKGEAADRLKAELRARVDRT